MVLEHYRPVVIAGLAAFAVAVTLTPVVRSAARRMGFVAVPRRDRWHSAPTSLMGGVAIFSASSLGTLLVVGPAELWPWIIPAVLMFAVGLVDDIVTLGPATKLALQVVAAAMLPAFGAWFGGFPWEPVAVMFTVFWLVGLTNAFNLLDNMDGLAAGVAALSGVAIVLMILAGGGPPSPVAVAAAALVGALAGFLIYNFNPASIFMGDSGSLYIGCLIATTAVIGPSEAGRGLASILSAPVLILLVPILDTAFVTVNRLLARRRVSAGGRDHTSHRLVAIGLSERRAVLVLYGVALGGGVFGYSLHVWGPGWTFGGLGLYLVGVALLAVRLGTVQVYSGDDFARLKGRSYTPLLVELTYRRRVFEVLLDAVLAAVAYYLAYRMRFSSADFATYFPVFLKSLPVILGCRVGSLLAVGGYSGVWRHFSVADLGRLLRGVLLGSLSAVLVLVYLYRFEDFSRGVFLIDMLVFGVLLVGSRLSFRLLQHAATRSRTGRNVLVYPAGDGGCMVVRELLNNQELGRRPVGFLDDDPALRGRRILGVPVHGGIDALSGFLQETSVDEVVVSSLKVIPERLARLQEVCADHDIPVVAMRFVMQRIDDPEDHHAGTVIGR